MRFDNAMSTRYLTAMPRRMAVVSILVFLAGCGGPGQPSGNTTPVTVTVTQPSITPAVMAAAGVGGQGVSVAGTATPATGAEVASVRYEVKTPTGATVFGGVGNGVVTAISAKTATWRMDTLPLQPGVNHLVVTAFDSQGRSGMADVWVTMPAVYIAVQTRTHVIFRATWLAQIPDDLRNSPETVILARVPGGAYQLGANASTTVGYNPTSDVLRTVNASAYYIALTELNRLQWFNITGGATLSAPTTPATSPVVDVSRNDVAAALASFGPVVGLGLRLPTDDEWGIAAHATAAVGAAYAFPGQTNPALYVRAYDVSGNPSDAGGVGGLIANGWGFYDMGGNVMEWTQSTVRDGSWSDNLVLTRVSDRFAAPDSDCIHPLIGVRLALSDQPLP